MKSDLENEIKEISVISQDREKDLQNMLEKIMEEEQADDSENLMSDSTMASSTFSFNKDFRKIEIKNKREKKRTSEPICVIKFPDTISEHFFINFQKNFEYLIRNCIFSKLLQNALQNTSNSLISKIFKEIYERIPELMIHPYGNYFCKKLYFFLSLEEKLQFLQILKSNFRMIATDLIGNYPIQTIIEHMSTKEEKQVIAESVKEGNNLPFLIRNDSSLYIIEKIVIFIPENQIQFLYEFVFENFGLLASNKNGICIVKRVIMHMKSEDNYRKLVSLISENFMFLIQDIYANITVQTALEHWSIKQVQPILKLFFNKFEFLSTTKFASNVVEKCLERGGEQIIDIFLNEIIINDGIGNLMGNNYGFYVLQTALVRASTSAKIYLINSILLTIIKTNDKKMIIKWKHICDSQLMSIYRCDLRNFSQNFNQNCIQNSGQNCIQNFNHNYNQNFNQNYIQNSNQNFN